MSDQATSKSDQHRRRWLLVLVALGMLGMLGYWWKAEAVFPAASIDLRLSQKRIQEIAHYWGFQAGYDKANVKTSTIFEYDNESKTFLEYELGSKQANALMKDKLPIWYWETRFCQPLVLDQFLCQISPNGQLVAFVHQLPNDLVLPSVSHAEAFDLAKRFVEDKVGIPIGAWEKIRDGTSSQIKRTDHFFTWENKEQSFAGAHLRIDVDVSGNKVTSFDHYLHVPEVWERKFSKLRSYNELLTEIASVFLSIFNVSTFFIFLWAFSQGLIRWRFSMVTALLVTLISVAESINSLPRELSSYTTTVSYTAYLTDFYVSIVTNAISTFIQSTILAGAAEALYRLTFPSKIAMEKLFTKLSLATRQTFTGLLAGHALFGIHLGWVVLYYLLGRQFGFWTPLDVQNAETLSSYVPALSASYIGAWAAFSEEFTYRILGTTIFSKLVRNFYLANLLQAVAWAFMHSNYAQEPPYARGLELTVVGFMYGLVLRYFGILPCLISHYVLDTFLGVVPLAGSTVPLLKTQALVAVIPFAVLLLFSLYLTLKKPSAKTAEEDLSNSSIPKEARPEILKEILPHEPYNYKALAKPARAALLLSIVLFTVIQFAFFPSLIGQDSRLSISRDDAVAVARAYLTRHNIDTSNHSCVAWVSNDLNANELQYALEKVQYQKTLSLARQVFSGLIWRVRFYRPLDPNSYLVNLDGQGRPVSFSVSLDEESAGAKLPQDTAVKQADQYLTHEQSKYSPLQLLDVFKQDRRNRTDYSLKFKSNQLSLPGADFEVNVASFGNLICNFNRGWQLPDQWLFEKARRGLKDQIAQYLNIFMNFAAIVAVVWWLKGMAATGTMHWRPAIVLAVIVTATLVPGVLNDWPNLFVGYDTSTPMHSFVTGQIVRQILMIISWLAVSAATAAFAMAAFRILSPQVHLSTIVKATVSQASTDRAHNKRDLWLDAILVGYSFGIGWQALEVIRVFCQTKISPSVMLAPLDSFAKLANVVSPSLETITDAFVAGIFSALAACSLAGLYAKYIPHRRYYFLLCLGGSIALNLGFRHWQDIVLGSILYFIGGASMYFLVAKLAKTNFLSYFLFGSSYSLAYALRLLIGYAPGFYINEIVILALVLISPVIYLFLFAQRQK